MMSPFIGIQHRADDSRIAGAVVGAPYQGLEHAAALHFVVVLADDPLLAADVPGTQNFEQRLV